MGALVLLVLTACGGDDVAPVDSAVGHDTGPDWPMDAAPDSNPGSPAEVVVPLAEGDVVGAGRDNSAVFWSLPYAAAPVGNRRFQPPAPAPTWTTPRDASVRGAACAQAGVAAYDGQEDCLFANVYAPFPLPTSPLPVMVWIHGGAFANGAGHAQLFDGRHLSELGNVIVVSINYRLGELGYLAHPALTAEGGGTSGNYGLLDQIEALRWVARNIGAFGGDPNQVTLFGESAGGHSICQLMVTPTARGLFHRAIIQSGICATPLRTLAEAEAHGEQVAAAVGCDVADPAACLRSVDPELLQSRLANRVFPGGVFYSGQLPVFPIIDGTLLPEQLAEAFAAGRQDTSIPVLIGSNTDEAELFQNSLSADPVTNEAEYRAALTRLYGASVADAVVAQYPVSDYDSPNHALTVATTDGIFTCSARHMARASSASGNSTWQYVFGTAPTGALFDGAFHSSEISFVFGTSSVTLGRPGSDGLAVQDAMQAHWTTFARTGTPGADPAWSPFDTAGDEHLLLQDPIGPATGHRSAECDFWDAQRALIGSFYD